MEGGGLREEVVLDGAVLGLVELDVCCARRPFEGTRRRAPILIGVEWCARGEFVDLFGLPEM